MESVPGEETVSKDALFLKRIWENDAFSSLTIMGMRVGMLAAKFILSIFIARFMGLEDLGLYGLIVGASGTVQAFMRGGIFPFLSREAVLQSRAELTHHLRHYGTGIVALYALLAFPAAILGTHFNETALALLILAVIFTEHLAFDSFVLINNLQYPKLANFIYSLQSASWIYLFVLAALLRPDLRSLEAMMVFWMAGGLVTFVLAICLSRDWPWKEAFSQKLEWGWYPGKIKSSFNLYLTDIVGVLNYYMSRYVVTLFLSLEMTGVYVFFSQVVTATCNLISSGVLVMHRPRLIKAHDSGDFARFNEIFRLCLRRTLLSTAGLSLLAAAAVPFLARLTSKDMLLNYLPLLWIMLGALLLKAGQMAAELGLFAMHKDRETLVITSIGFLIAAVVGSLGVIFFGIYGIVVDTFAVALVTIAYARSKWPQRPSEEYEEAERYV